MNFSGTPGGVSFTWTNNTPSIGLVASGSGNIPAFSATNATNAAVTATITVTPVLTGRAYIPNNVNAGTVSVINLATGASIGSPITVGSFPFGVAVLPDRNKVFVSNSGSDNVSVISTATNTVTATINHTNPHGLVASPDGSRVYVGGFSAGTVSRIDAATNVSTFMANVPSPEGMAVSPDGARLYVASATGNSLASVNTTTNAVTNIPVGTAPHGVAVTPNGQFVYVANNGSDNVSVVNTGSNTVVATIVVGDAPLGVAVSPDGTKVYVANSGSDNVSVISTASNTVTATVNVGDYPYGVSVTPDGTQAYVANKNSNNLSVINTATNAVTGPVAAGSSPIALGNFIVACATAGTAKTFDITVNPTAAISYTGSPYCTSAASASVTRTGAAGGTYSYVNASLAQSGLGNFDAATGTFEPATSTPGTYTVTYTVDAGGGCGIQTPTATVTITAPPTATLSYAGTPFCSNAGTISPTLNGTNAYTGGTYSAPAGLSINTTTGAINTGTSTAGTYTVTYSTPAAGGCAAATATASVTITARPTATLSYTGTPFCSNAGTINPTLTGTNAYTGGTFSAPAGLSINATTGVINTGTSTAGTYTVTYSTPAADGCAAVTATTSVTITARPTATLSYTGTPFCSNAGTVNPTLNGTNAYTGGSYSAPAGLSINATTGAINTGTSTAGTYTVTYSTPVAGGCAAVTATASVTITARPTATISYAGTPYCSNAGTVNPTLAGTNAYTGGTYSAPAGLMIDAATGAINTGTSTAGTYTVTYSTPAAGGCTAVTATTSVTITARPTATLAYAGTPYCSNAGTVNPTLGGTNAYTGGSYSAPAGLSIDATTGAINTGTSTAGTYTVTYATPVAGGCAAVTATASVTITARPTATLSYAGTPYCSNAGTVNPTLNGTNAYTGGTYSAPAGLSINAATGAINTGTSTAGTYTVTYSTPVAGGCAAVTATASVTITARPTATLSYAGTPFCKDLTTAVPTLTGTNAYTGGTYTYVPVTVGTPAYTLDAFAAGTGTFNPSTSNTNLSGNTVYTVTYATPVAGGCAAVTAAATVTIKPTPTVNPIANQTVCAGTSTNAVNFSGIVSPTTYNWTNSNTNFGLAAATSSGNIASFTTLVNSDIVQTSTITVTPTADGCTGAPVTFTITANPTPAIPAQNQVICSDATFTVNPATSLPGTIVPANTTYSWAQPSAPGLSNLAAGNNATNISGAPKNNTNAAVMVVYNVMPTSGAAGSCPGAPFNVTVTVNAKPVVPSPQTVTVCSDAQFTLSPVDASPTTIIPNLTTYTWTAPTLPTGLTGGAAGNAAASITGTLTNNTNAALVAPYTVTPTSGAAGNCVGANFTVNVTVNPKPKMRDTVLTICSGAAFTLTYANAQPTNIVPTGTTYTWTAPVSSPPGAVTNGSAQATGLATISQTLNNPTSNAAAFLTYTVRATGGASVGSCLSNPFSVRVNVNPIPAPPVITTTTAALCQFSRHQNFTATGADMNDANVKFTWSITDAGTTPASNFIDTAVTVARNIGAGTATSNAIISFLSPNDATINVRSIATYHNVACTSAAATRLVDITGGADNLQSMVIHNGQHFVHLRNTVDTYQWGFDTKDLVRNDVPNERMQSYFLPAPDTVNRHYYAIVTKGACSSKNYYNKSYRRVSLPVPQPEAPAAVLTVAPNPVRGSLHLLGRSLPAGRFTVRVTDVSGRTLMSRQIDNTAGLNRASLDVRALPSGLYFVTLTGTDRAAWTAKFIKE
ncbi:hypothetical protein GCM10023184_43340 [Flaviaesturariibacter amylovorans]|uniref:T9SS type A sorting domain-containing protein n=1 Tax=Flaviaesturariibacter amylovorans TaxID=1084520 RepID=A0ABP8HRI3_9BACT